MIGKQARKTLFSRGHSVREILGFKSMKALVSPPVIEQQTGQTCGYEITHILQICTESGLSFLLLDLGRKSMLRNNKLFL